MKGYSLLDLNTEKVSPNLDVLFPNWRGAQERVCVYSPHDDDAILGAGYAMRAALDGGAQVHIIIVCSGNAGYSTIEAKDTIVETRKRETLACYAAFGIPAENIVFLDVSDFSALSSLGWQVAPAGKATSARRFPNCAPGKLRGFWRQTITANTSTILRQA